MEQKFKEFFGTGRGELLLFTFMWALLLWLFFWLIHIFRMFPFLPMSVFAYG